MMPMFHIFAHQALAFFLSLCKMNCSCVCLLVDQYLASFTLSLSTVHEGTTNPHHKERAVLKLNTLKRIPAAKL